MNQRWVWLGSFWLAANLAVAQSPLTVTFVHTNDLHAHIEPTRIRDADFGGYARHMTLFRRIRATEPNPVFLNAGDTFQGTLFFNIYEGLADLSIKNLLGYQAMTVGNHEFDRGPEPLLAFAKRANFPLLAANLDLNGNPDLQAWIKPSTILEIQGQKVAIVGAITPETPSIASPGPTVKFLPVRESVQREVDRLTAEGINKIVVMTHIGFAEDRELAGQLRNVDLIIGGHSHTPLGTPNLPGWRPASGPYPVELKDADGQTIYVVQAWEWGKVVGKFQLQFDAQGRIEKVLKAEPIVIDQTIEEDLGVKAFVDALNKPIVAMASTVVGEITVPLESREKIGYFVADSYLAATQNAGAVVAFMNPGGVRAGLDQGPITYGEASTICPFRNTLVVADLTGRQIEVLLSSSRRLIPSRGSSFVWKDGKAESILIAGQPLDPDRTYKVTVNSFMAGGGDDLKVLTQVPKLETGLLDIDAFVDWLKANRPLSAPTDDRIR